MFIAPSWDQIYVKSIVLATAIRKRERVPIDYIVGVSRGGLVLARIISDLLDIQDISVIKCEYYSGISETKNKPIIKEKLHSNISGKNVLAIDDVADTGGSISVIKQYLLSKNPRILRFATIYLKPTSNEIPDYFVSKTSAWIIFPWELYETLKLFSRRRIKAREANTHIPTKYARLLIKMDPKLSGRNGV
jgi:hypoxanthine phosphoribosyltransferase